MSLFAFRALLDALMVSDPWPHPCFEELEEFANFAARWYMFEDWIDAYHNLKV
jgi:hypothetical protein